MTTLLSLESWRSPQSSVIARSLPPWRLRPSFSLAVGDYQLNCSLRFMSGWPPMLEVRWSALILANVFGLRKSTVVVGLLQA